jgi:hypothetical protein
MGQNGFHSRQGQSPAGVDLHDAGMGDIAALGPGIQQAGQMHVSHIFGVACDLGQQVVALDAGSDDGFWLMMRWPPVRRGGCSNGVQNFGVSRAATDVAGDGKADVFGAGAGVLVQQGFGCDQNAGCAEAALRRAALHKAFLQGMKLAVCTLQTFNGGDFGSLGFCSQNQAGVGRAAIEQDGAGAAFAHIAAFLVPVRPISVRSASSRLRLGATSKSSRSPLTVQETLSLFIVVPP